MNRKDPLMQQANVWVSEGRKLALATVVETWGSSPCPSGSQMIINDKAGFAGSVSGGCIEASVVSESLEILNSGGFELTEYGVSSEVSFAAGLACGGTVRVMLELLDEKLLKELMGARPAVRVVDLRNGKWTFVREDLVSGNFSLDNDTMAAARNAMHDERAQIYEAGEDRYFMQPLIPAYRLLIVGAVRIAQSLAPMAAELGFDVTIIDPRRAFSTDERFPNVALVREWPDKAVSKLGFDAHTALVTLTHDAEPDDMALGMALNSDVFYIGALGSKRTHAARIDRLRESGFSNEDISRIHAPVGLDIGAKTPAEIAVSILSQIIEIKNMRGKRH